MARIINESKWKGESYIMEWFSDQDFTQLKNILSVRAVLFDDKGKICVIGLREKLNWDLPGGDIKAGETWQQALIRETEQEADVELHSDSLKPLGYIKVTPKNKDNPLGVHYLLRVAGKISKINEQKIDEETDLMNERAFVLPENFPAYCQWGKIGDVLMTRALEYWKENKK